MLARKAVRSLWIIPFSLDLFRGSLGFIPEDVGQAERQLCSRPNVHTKVVSQVLLFN